MGNTLVVVNFKNYQEATLENGSKLLGNLRSVNVPVGTSVRFAMSTMDLRSSGPSKYNDIYAQHVDPEGMGSSTGKVTMEMLKKTGIQGSLLNHSENRISPGRIRETVEKSRSEDFTVILCVESADEASSLAPLRPSYIAYEPPELIGGDISVSSAKPEIIEEVVGICEDHDVPVLVGAGVKNRFDLERSIELGARGVLIASGIVRSSDPAGSLNSLISS